MDKVRARKLHPHERKNLRRMKRQLANQVNRRHARIILLSRGGVRNREIAARVDCTPQWVRVIIHRFNDGGMITVDVGRYEPNAWGLLDMHGNVGEWTRSAYRPYPYDPSDGREDTLAVGTKAVRGGSWYDRPHRATSSFRLPYQPWQRVYNVGFRVVMEVHDGASASRSSSKPVGSS